MQALKSVQIIEAKAAMNKEIKFRMEFNTDSFDIIIIIITQGLLD